MKINIYKTQNSDCPINHFHNKSTVDHTEIVIKTKNVYGNKYTYAEPKEDGWWAFGGNILYTCNSAVAGEWNEPIKLHDRNMKLENGNNWD